MPATEIAATPKRRPFFRFWFPLIVLALAAGAVTTFWAWPAEDWERAKRVFGTVLTVQITLFMLTLWLLGLSGLRWRWRIGILAGLIAVVFASVRRIHFNGDMEPSVEFRWDPTHDDRLEANRLEQQQLGGPDTAVVLDTKATNFPEYRGSRRDGIVHGPVLARDWKQHPPRMLWRQPVGGGYAGFAVGGNVAITIEQRREEEAVVCYDAATGRQLWLYSYPAHFAESLGGTGPRATPTIAGQDVYSLGATGRLVCLTATTGKFKWDVDILKDNDNVRWGMSGSPLVYDSVVVVNAGSQRGSTAGRALVAYDRQTGKQVWAAGSTPAGYSSPQLAELAGTRQILLLDGEGLGGYDSADGRELWRHPWTTDYGINVAQPLVFPADRVFISSGYGVGGAMLQIAKSADKWSAKEIWKTKALRSKFASPVAYQGHIYGLDDGILACIDERTGNRNWKEGRHGHGQLLLTENLLLILSESGKLVLVEATPEAYRELGSFQALEGKTWNCPALADGKAFIRNHMEMACYELTTPAR